MRATCDRWACGAALACALMLFYSAGAPEAAGQPAQLCHLNPAVRGLPPHCCAVAAGWQGRAYKPNIWCWSRVRTFLFRFQQTAFDCRQFFACWRACCSSTSSCSPRGGVHARRPSRVQVEERIAQFEADMKRRGDTWKMHLKKNAPGTYMLFVVCVSVCAVVTCRDMSP